MWSTGINRNIVECKVSIYSGNICKVCSSINRNIVECKDKGKQYEKEQRQRINRNIVECKENHSTHKL